MAYGIRRGIVEEVVSSTEYKVRIINYDSAISDPSKTLTSDLATASVMIQPGTNVTYNVDDRVYLAFNKDELSDPVIIGAMLTENYTTDFDQIEIPQLETAIEEIKKYLEEIAVDQYYTHTKYSNDNGLTFTSLYEYKDNGEEMVGQVNYITQKDIVIDPESKVVYWSIVDENSVDCTDNFIIETTIRAGHYDIDEEGNEFFEAVEEETFTDKMFNIPFTMQTYEASLLDFRVVKTVNYDNYHFVLTTDKNVIGSVQGDYLGICTTTDPEAPDDPSLYSWTSFKETITDIIENASEDLEKRVRTLEVTTYGDEEHLGLVDGISVNENQVDVHGLDNLDVVFNTSKSMFIDNNNNNFTTQTVKHKTVNSDRSFIDTYTSNGHFTLIIRAEQ